MTSSDTYQRLDLERDGPVLRIWLDRPDQRNAHDQLMLSELVDAFESLATAFRRPGRRARRPGGPLLLRRGRPSGAARAGRLAP